MDIHIPVELKNVDSLFGVELYRSLTLKFDILIVLSRQAVHPSLGFHAFGI